MSRGPWEGREVKTMPVGDLPPYDHDRLCPKCHFIVATTHFYVGEHNAAGEPCSLPGAALMSLASGWPSLGEGTAPSGPIWVMPEHFERECPNCKHRWAEAVAE